MLKIEKEILEKLYLEQELSMKEISKELGAAVGSVYNYIKKYGIKSRPIITEKSKKKISEANRGRVSPRKGTHLSAETKKKMSESKRGKFRKPSKYGGHTKKRSDGYISVYKPSHPLATKDGYVLEHILVMEEKIGRIITRDEVVHHINHVRDDNRIENLQLMTFKEHAAFHLRERRAKKKGAMTYQ